MLDPRYKGNDLCAEETDKAMKHILENNPDMMASIVNYKAKSGPFHPYMFVREIVNSVSPIAWWHSQSERLTDRRLTLIDQLFNAPASSVGVDRVFPHFDWFIPSFVIAWEWKQLASWSSYTNY